MPSQGSFFFWHAPTRESNPGPSANQWTAREVPTKVLLRERQRECRHRGEDSDHGGRDRSDVATRQGMPAASATGRGDSPLEPPEGGGPCEHLDFSH